MAFTAGTIWEVETGGSDANNGGGFDTNATFSTNGAATSANGASPVFTSASYNFVAGDVGAWIYIKSGTNWNPGWYKIVSVAANAATLDAAIANYVDKYFGPGTVLGCATVASPTGATWGVDYSQAGASRITFTDLVIGAVTTTFTSVANPVGVNFIGNTINITSGTGFTVQRVYVVSIAAAVATVDKSLGTAASTGGNGRLGGALSSIGLASSLLVTGQTINVQTGAYSITSATVSVTGGCLTATGLNDIRISGYATVRGDMGTPPVLTASGISTFTMFTAIPSDSFIINLTLDGASLTSGRGLKVDAGRTTLYKVWAKNFTNSGIYGFNNTSAICLFCRVSGCSTQPAFYINNAYACEAYGNTVTGFPDTGGLRRFVDCIAYGNSGASSDGFVGGNTDTFIGCSSYGNGRHGFSGTRSNFVDCLSENNAGWGYSITNASFLLHCGAYNNTSGTVTLAAVPVFNESFITATASFFANGAASDFSLNNNAGGGAAVRAKAKLGLYPDGLTTSYADMGAAQHADPAGAAGMLFIPDMAGT